MTKDELKAALDELEVEYKASASKAELEALLEEAQASEEGIIDVGDLPDGAEESAESEEESEEEAVEEEVEEEAEEEAAEEDSEAAPTRAEYLASLETYRGVPVLREEEKIIERRSYRKLHLANGTSVMVPNFDVK